VLNVIRNGTKAIAIAQLSIAHDDIDRTLSLDRQVAVIGSLSVLLLALLLSPLITATGCRPPSQQLSPASSTSAITAARGDDQRAQQERQQQDRQRADDATWRSRLRVRSMSSVAIDSWAMAIALVPLRMTLSTTSEVEPSAAVAM